MTNTGSTNRELVRRHWGEAAPEWVVVLADVCDQRNQTKVAQILGVSGAMINQALHNIYAGRLDKLEARVRGELMKETLTCPVLGEITKRRCIDEQSKPFAATNALRVELRRECARCENKLKSAA